jgi:hypothetical protein
MTIVHLLAGFVVAMLLLMARSAWKQGEVGHFLIGLGVVAGLLGAVFGTVELVAWLG